LQICGCHRFENNLAMTLADRRFLPGENLQNTSGSPLFGVNLLRKGKQMDRSGLRLNTALCGALLERRRKIATFPLCEKM
jgi:hypothetical protein